MNETILNQFYESLERKSAINRQNLSYLTYSYKTDNPTEENKYDFFPSVIKSDKIVIYVHGGRWTSLNLSSSVFLAHYFVKNKYNFAAIGYDLCPSVSLREMIVEVRQAIRSILEQQREIRSVYLMGHSAGAHLALSALLCNWLDDKYCLSEADRSRLSGLVLLSGSYDLEGIVRSPLNATLRLTAEEAIQMSPIRFVKNIREFKSDLMVLILVEGDDLVDFKNQSRTLYDELRMVANEDSVHFITVEDVNHFSIVERIGNDDYELTDLIIDFLDRI